MSIGLFNVNKRKVENFVRIKYIPYPSSSSDSSYPFPLLDIIQPILTFCTAARNKSVVFMLNQVLKFLGHENLGRPTPLFPSSQLVPVVSVSYTHLTNFNSL